MSGSYLYCPTPGCGEYLGSLGGDSCPHCGWRAGEPRRFDDDWAPNPNDDQGQPLGVMVVHEAQPDDYEEQMAERASIAPEQGEKR